MEEQLDAKGKNLKGKVKGNGILVIISRVGLNIILRPGCTPVTESDRQKRGRLRLL